MIRRRCGRRVLVISVLVAELAVAAYCCLVQFRTVISLRVWLVREETVYTCEPDTYVAYEKAGASPLQFWKIKNLRMV